jgi:hypothetical protein
MTQREQRDFDILTEMYRRAFAASTPPADFDALVAVAETNALGQKVIPYLDYECEQETMDRIVTDVLREYRVPKWRRPLFRNSFMLGCSPKTKQPLK